MRVFIFTLAVMALFHFSISAPTDTAAVDKIQAEYDHIVKETIPAVIAQAENQISATIQESVNSFTVVLLRAREKLVGELETLGGPTRSVTTRFDLDLRNAVDEMNDEFFDAVLDKEINAELERGHSQILSSTRSQVASIKSAVRRTPAASRCWDAYKAGLEEKYTKFSEIFHSKSQEAVADFNVFVDLQGAQITSIVKKYDTEANASCPTRDAKCLADFYNKNYSKIRETISKTTRSLSDTKDTSINGITKKLSNVKAQAEKDVKVLNIDASTCIKIEEAIAAGELEKYAVNPTQKPKIA